MYVMLMSHLEFTRAAHPSEVKTKSIHFLRCDSWDHATPLSLDAQCIPDDIACRSAIE